PSGMDRPVKRAGPGGIGLCMNPYSLSAVLYHFGWLSERFKEGRGRSPRAFYYDSFENEGNWCPEFLDSFRRLRGYDLADHANALGGEGGPDEVKRVMCDYRETLSDVLIECVREIAAWSEQRGSGLRMQAHGSPANLLDMYAAASIPETEVFGANQFDIPGYRRDPDLSNPETPDILVNRFASSAAHVTGRGLILAESFTWLRNHFHTALSHIKAESDQLFLNGINGIYYHGLCYSPKDADWPGWLFYASTQANYRNSIFRDIRVLNDYITRCQSVLQQGKADHDVLLYWPVYDLWMGGGSKELRFRVHDPTWLKNSACGEAAQWMVDRGYTFDYISDKQIQGTIVKDGTLVTQGGSTYGILLIPAADYMDTGTLKHLVNLAREGATILFWRQMPWNVPGWHEHVSRKEELKSVLEAMPFDSEKRVVKGTGQIFLDDDLKTLMDLAKISPESMIRSGLRFTRRKLEDQTIYFMANHSSMRIDGWVALAAKGRSALLMDPMTGRTGVAEIRGPAAKPEIYLQMEPGETRMLRVFSQETTDGMTWSRLGPAANTIELKGTWEIEFVEGGPYLPETVQTERLVSWTDFDLPHVNNFAGAARYTIEIDVPKVNAVHWFLDLGDVRESARIRVNKEPAGVLVAHPYRLDITEYLREGVNEISIEVTNLSANRIRDLDIHGIDWKKFYDINFVNHLYRPFDASIWPLKPSGLLGPVRLIPYRPRTLKTHLKSYSTIKH
ncbi:MAG: glycoside hydrolase family 2, partial [Bacteroides sp. SM23_62]